MRIMVKEKNKLFTIFREYMVRKEKEGSISEIKPSVYKSIKFYEWSDVNRPPITFYGIDSFIRFLDRCGITLYGYQKGLIASMSTPHITCEKGKKTLLIRGSYEVLKEAVKDSSVVDSITFPNQVPLLPPVYGHGGYEYQSDW